MLCRMKLRDIAVDASRHTASITTGSCGLTRPGYSCNDPLYQKHHLQWYGRNLGLAQAYAPCHMLIPLSLGSVIWRLNMPSSASTFPRQEHQ